ncbi:conserved hypothetical protein [Desulfamplus magnetovallimortis]|uniref:Uncharacterized protein n=1 Tax=Desulfamplus magnetovallimortis TaxID=1246637 RepID=A0A1W1HF78_9BACT|nr:hypothetical protein [Desulfamplus magnetovallimortis]SLM31137.1 conserved hypothetical protein [Desulfamplus magnetovallimortis]
MKAKIRKSRLKTLSDVRRFLARVLNDFDNDLIEEGKARGIAYMCSILKDLII